MGMVYGGVGSGIPMNVPAAVGTTVTPKRPSHITTQTANKCKWCNMVWVSSPYDPADDPPEHRLTCVDGWTPEYHVWTILYWEGYLEPEVEADSSESG